MKETSTPISTKTRQSSTKYVQPAPRRSTIEFIKGFARAYAAEMRLHAGIQGMILN